MLLSKLQGNFTKGWRIVLKIPTQRKEDLLPDFIKGEKDHTNPRFRKN
jgi:hypothetical protein